MEGSHEVFSAVEHPAHGARDFGRVGGRPDPARAEFSDRAGAAAATAAAAGNGRGHLRHHLRFGGDELPEYMCRTRPRLAGQPAVQPELHHATAHLQAAVLDDPDCIRPGRSAHPGSDGFAGRPSALSGPSDG